MRLVRALLLFVVTCAELAPGAKAQLPTRPTGRPPVAPARPARMDTLRTKADSLRAMGDTLLARDTLTRANFAPPDSVMQRLLNLPGYTTTQYQGGTVAFDALTRAIQLTTKAIVQRDSQLVKSDTISYNGSGSAIRVGSDSNKRRATS